MLSGQAIYATRLLREGSESLRTIFCRLEADVGVGEYETDPTSCMDRNFRSLKCSYDSIVLAGADVQLNGWLL